MNIISYLFLGLSSIILCDSIYTYYNLKYHNKYKNYNITNKNVTHIEVYQKNKKQKKFLFDKTYNLSNSISIIDDKKYKNIKFINLIFYMNYKNDDIFRIKFNFLSQLKNNDIHYKTIENQNAFCLLNGDNIISLSSSKDSLIQNNFNENISYFYLCFVLFVFFYKLNKS
jgi:hypothetical protein